MSLSLSLFNSSCPVSGILEAVFQGDHSPVGRDRVHPGRGAPEAGISGTAEER